MGTTASGKSEMSLAWAELFSGSILNCDSVQVYKGLDIGAAKPTPDEMLRVPHSLFSFVEKGRSLTTGEYRRAYFQKLTELKPEAPIFVVGGSGFYFQALEKGMYPLRKGNPEVAQQIDLEMSTSHGREALLIEFQTKDPVAAARIHVNDVYRLGRAMEIIRTEGRSLTEIQSEFQQQGQIYPYPFLKIGITWSKEKLKERVVRRVDLMFESGLLREVYGLLKEGLENWRPLKSVGYKECVDFLKSPDGIAFYESGDLPKPQSPCLMPLKSLIQQNTMALAKKQKTWFQRDPDIHWVDGETGFPQATELVKGFVVS